MKAALLRTLRAPLEIAEVDEPVIGPNDVLVRTRSCGICRTDLHIQDGVAYVPELPHVGGHEPAGVVTRCGDAVTAFRPGDRVVPYLFLTEGNLVPTACAPAPTEIAGILGVTRAGGFAEFFAAPEKNLLRIPDGVSFEAAGLVSCAVITAVHAVRRAHLPAGSTALVIGAGGVGLLLIQILKGEGMTVLATDRSEVNCALAREAGADRAFVPGEGDPREEVREMCPHGVDGIFDLVGLQSTLAAAAAYVRNGGKIIVIGEEAEAPAITTIEIAQRELQIIGSRNGGIDDARAALGLLGRGIVNPVISQRFPFARINDALDYVRTGRAHGRVIVEFPAGGES